MTQIWGLASVMYIAPPQNVPEFIVGHGKETWACYVMYLFMRVR